MKPATRLLTVAVLVACAWWRMRPVPAVHAQIMQCDSYDRRTDYPCNSCCSAGNTSFNNITDGFVEGAGMETIVQTYQDCGKSVSCPGPYPDQYCGPTYFNRAVDDPAECCLPSGDPCNQGTCCAGLICLSGNVCGPCIQDGNSCYYDTDCCSGWCNPDSNTCGEPCGLTGEYCSDDSDCCSYACFGNYCQ